MEYETRKKINDLGLYECFDCLGWFELEDLVQWDDENICDACLEDREKKQQPPTEKQIRNAKISCVLIPVTLIGLGIIDYLLSRESYA